MNSALLESFKERPASVTAGDPVWFNAPWIPEWNAKNAAPTNEKLTAKERRQYNRIWEKHHNVT